MLASTAGCRAAEAVGVGVAAGVLPAQRAAAVQALPPEMRRVLLEVPAAVVAPAVARALSSRKTAWWTSTGAWEAAAAEVWGSTVPAAVRRPGSPNLT